MAIRRIVAIALRFVVTLAWLAGSAMLTSLLFDGTDASVVVVFVFWAMLLLPLAWLWVDAASLRGLRGSARRWLTREWRILPFYVAAILLSLAALRYLLED